MKKITTTIALAVILTACGGEEETEVTITDQQGEQIYFSVKTTRKEEIPFMNTMDGHPFAKYSNAEDAKILKSFPMLVGYCGRQYTQDRCLSGIKEFQYQAENLGRNIETKYLNNPAFWNFQVNVANKEKEERKKMTGMDPEMIEKKLAFTNEQKRRLKAFQDGKY